MSGRVAVARVIAILGMIILPTVVLSTGPAAALCVGSSICNPANAPLLAEFATSAGPTLTTAATTAGATVGGASAAAPISAVPLTAAATATGSSSSVWGAAVGKIVTLLGGLAAWKFIAPSSPETTLPTGTGGVSKSGQGAAKWYKYAQASPVILTHEYSFTITWSGAYNGKPTSATWVASVTPNNGPNTGATDCTSTNGLYCKSSVYATSVTRWHRCYAQSAQTSPGSWVGPNFSAMNMPWANGTSQAFGLSSSSNPCTYGIYDAKIVLAPHADTGYPSVDLVWSPNDPVVPNRWIEQTVTCKTAAGTTSTVTSSTSPNPMTANQLVDVAGLMCPSGSRAVGVTATVKTTGGTDVPLVDAPYVPGEGLDSATVDVPEPCYTGSTACTLDLQRATSTSQTTWESINPEDYPDWWTDPQRDILYRCRYGTAETWITVPIANCSVYKDGPTVGDPVPTTDTPTNDNSGDCNFGWSDLLTGGIFIRGGKCILQWAFVPSDGFIPNKLTEVQSSWSGTAPVVAAGTIHDAWAPWWATHSVPTNCEGPSFEIPAWGWEDLHPFSACGEIAQIVVPIGRPLIAAMAIIACLTASASQLGKGINFDFVTKGKS
jgi:hypothetical protein